ncbi:hypothetical protein K438DRAFT_2015123, partial [Mycena galopus ATCC 62051]
MIPLADIDLQHEIRADPYRRVVYWQPERTHVRRIYIAKVEGRKSTVAMYRGNDAEEEWREDVA